MDLPSSIRPGLVIHSCAIRESIERGYSHYDFLAGASRYKMQLANNVRPLVALRLRKRTLRSSILTVADTGLNFAKTLRRQLARRNSE